MGGDWSFRAKIETHKKIVQLDQRKFVKGRISSGDGNQIDVPIASGEQYYVGFTLIDLAAVGANLPPAGTVIQTPPYTILAGDRLFGFVGGSDSLAYGYNESAVIVDLSGNYGVFVSSGFTLDLDDFDISLNTTDFGIEVGLGNNYEVGAVVWVVGSPHRSQTKMESAGTEA